MNQRDKESLLDRKVAEETFVIISPVLDPDEESEWLVSDGKEVIRVVVVDQEFLQAVKDGKVTFTSGCSIVCELEVTQWLTEDGVRSDYRVHHVTEVIPPREL